MKEKKNCTTLNYIIKALNAKLHPDIETLVKLNTYTTNKRKDKKRNYGRRAASAIGELQSVPSVTKR